MADSVLRSSILQFLLFVKMFFARKSEFIEKQSLTSTWPNGKIIIPNGKEQFL